MPPSSLYCCQRSVSRISAAERNRRIAASPLLNLFDVGFFASAVADSKEARPAPTPTATPLATSERRLMPCCDSPVDPACVPAASTPEACLAEVDIMYLSPGELALKSCYYPMTPVRGVPSSQFPASDARALAMQIIRSRPQTATAPSDWFTGQAY